MKRYKKIADTLKSYNSIWKELMDLGVIKLKKDFTSQIGEWLVAEIYSGEIAKSASQKDWDIKVGNKYLQVKSHAKGVNNKARWSVIKKNEFAQVDFLIIVVFTSNYKLKEFYKTPWKKALELINCKNNRHTISWDAQSIYKIELEHLPNQKLISIFK